MSLTFLGKFLPYFLIKRWILRYGERATLKIGDTELKGRVDRLDNGEWFFIEDREGLLKAKIALQNKLRKVDSELAQYEEQKERLGWDD